MRRRAHRWLPAVALATVISACAQASAEAPPTEVRGVQLEAGAASATPIASMWVFDPPPPPIVRPAGDRVISVALGGVERHWTVVVPPGTTEEQPLPMVIVLHGVGGKGAAMRRLGFEGLAATSGVAVAYPDASGGSWNDGRPGMEPVSGAPVDDVAFLRTLIARSADVAGIDPSRVGITGFSNGGLMAARAACDMAGELRAAVLVAGAGPRDVAQRCAPGRPLPVMVVFGTADTVVPYDGGSVAPYAGKPRGQVAAVRDVIELWRANNGCSGLDTTDRSGTTPPVADVRGRGCRAEVEHLRITGAGHEWVSNATFDTTAETWRFLLRHLD